MSSRAADHRGRLGPRRDDVVFVLCFAVILVAMALTSYLAPLWEHTAVVLTTVLVAGLAWCGAVLVARRGGGSLALVILGALVLRGVGLGSWPDLSDDIYRYAWEGELVGEGISPYAFAPDSPLMEGMREGNPRIYAAMNNPEISAAYPPVTQAACALVVNTARELGIEAVFLLRFFFTVCDLLVLWPLCTLLGRLNLPRTLAVVWAWSPLVLMEFSGSGHFDSLGILLLLSALALLSSTRQPAARAWLGSGLLAGAIVVKYIPLAALPFVAREGGGLRRVVLVLALSALSFVPLLWMTGGFDGLLVGMGEYGLRWQSSGLVQPHLAQLIDGLLEQDGRLLDARRVTRFVLGGLWFGTAVLVWHRRLDAVQSTGILLGAFLVLTPTLHPWYVTWVVPFVALRPRASWIWLMLTIPCYYQILEGWKTQGIWEQSQAVSVIVALPFGVLLLYELLRSPPSKAAY